MSDVQFVCALFAAPFLLLSLFWLLGLLLIERIDRAERERVRVPVRHNPLLDNIDTGDRK